jgi:WD40 repeat protein
VSGIKSDSNFIASMIQKIVNVHLKKDDAHDEDVNCVAFNLKKQVLATCSDDNSIKIWVGK